MQPYMRIGGLIIVIIVVAGCASHDVIPAPGKITLEAAMAEVAKGLNDMYDLRKDHVKSGLIASEVTVVFNISAKADDDGKLYIEAGANLAEALKVAKAGAEAGSKIEAIRGNTVTIKFSNILLAPKETLVMTKSPEEILKLMQVLKQQVVGIESLSPPISK